MFISLIIFDMRIPNENLLSIKLEKFNSHSAGTFKAVGQ